LAALGKCATSAANGEDQPVHDTSVSSGTSDKNLPLLWLSPLIFVLALADLEPSPVKGAGAGASPSSLQSTLRAPNHISI